MYIYIYIDILHIPRSLLHPARSDTDVKMSQIIADLILRTLPQTGSCKKTGKWAPNDK